MYFCAHSREDFFKNLLLSQRVGILKEPEGLKTLANFKQA